MMCFDFMMRIRNNSCISVSGSSRKYNLPSERESSILRPKDQILKLFVCPRNMTLSDGNLFESVGCQGRITLTDLELSSSLRSVHEKKQLFSFNVPRFAKLTGYAQDTRNRNIKTVLSKKFFFSQRKETAHFESVTPFLNISFGEKRQFSGTRPHIFFISISFSALRKI